jgi:CheY-like chemotaxis protein/HPt (histidine-containing phosphotransfer) domain-containing protein
MLEKLGYQSDVVENGRDALAALERGGYVAILMDCQMPILDGFGATQRIRDGERHEAIDERKKSGASSPSPLASRHIPIVALTANAMSGDRERCLAAGMDDYLTKPIRKEELKGALERWIQTSQPSRTMDSGNTPPPNTPAAADAFPMIFDTTTMLRNIGGDRELLDQLIVLFLQRYQPMLENIRIALAGQDQRAIEQAAHLLKGTAGNLCAPEVVLAAGRLEALGRLGTLLDAPVIYTQLEAAVVRLVKIIETRTSSQPDKRNSAA